MNTEENKEEIEKIIEDLEPNTAATEMPEPPASEDWQKKYVSLYAEFDNFRRRSQKEKLDFFKTAGEDLIKKLLPILDDFERALQSHTGEKNPFETGLFLIVQKMQKTFKEMGLEEINIQKGADFDAQTQEAIVRVPAPSADMAAKVVDIVEKGYTVNGKIVRYAKVVVAEE